MTNLFIAQTSMGLEDVLVNELKDLGLKSPTKNRGFINFEGTWEDCYRINLASRIATRVLYHIQTLVARNPEELYFKVQEHDYTQYIDPNGTFAVETHGKSHFFTDSRFVSLKVKDAIADQFRNKFEIRPNVEKINPDMKIHIRMRETDFEISLDTSGEGLFKRGYRVETVEAPMKEHLAAGLLKMAGWEKGISIVDPMCGSGTILIEAALAQLNIVPGSSRVRFGFEKLKIFEKETFKNLLEFYLEREVLPETAGIKFYGYDIEKKCIHAAKTNSYKAGVSDLIEFKKLSIQELNPPCDSGMLILNPPYGERLSDDENLKDIYRDLGYVLKNRFKGWTCWVLSGHKELATFIGLKASQKVPVWNGPIECRFLKYEVRKN